MKEIIVRKPKFKKFFGFILTRQYKWESLLPDNGDRIKLTWLPNPINNPTEKNAYIGMEGVVCDMNKIDGTFSLMCDTCRLVCLNGTFNYEKINGTT